MNGFVKCLNGHYYSKDLASCPYCGSRNPYAKINEFATVTPISPSASDLLTNANIILEFGAAPDGLKRYVSVDRKRGGMYLRSRIAQLIGCDEGEISSELEQKLMDIDDVVTGILLKKNIYDIRHPEMELEGDYYVSEIPINAIVPETLLTQILGRGSKLDLLYSEHEKNAPDVEMKKMALNTASCAAFGDEKFQEARREVELQKYLAISLLNNSKKVLGIRNRERMSIIKSVADFQSEDISIFQPTIVIKEYGMRDVMCEWDAQTYAKYQSEIANKGDKSLYLRIPRQRVAKAISTMFTKLNGMHKNGLVHCDLKPQNILCFADGLTPFDSIDVKNGDIAAGMTANYCAPEQILTRPVSPATDIYNLGLMILSVVDGIVYGKKSSYVIPTGGTDVKNIELLSEPMIYIDYEKSNVKEKEGIAHWRLFLEKCLAFDPKKRFQSIEIMAAEYERILSLYPLTNDIEFQPSFGRLSMVEHNGGVEAGWFMCAE